MTDTAWATAGPAGEHAVPSGYEHGVAALVDRLTGGPRSHARHPHRPPYEAAAVISHDTASAGGLDPGEVLMAGSLSLVVPSGHLTLGNLLGAVLGWTTDRHQAGSLYGVADLHALTLEHDPATVRALTVEQVGVLLAAGLDPARCTVFVQSHVPAHTELLWLLESTVHVGELQRMVQFKQKAGGHKAVRASLLTYPVLMAADILLYGAEQVPVGDDQRQHLELARTIARRFNARYGETFVVPHAVTPPVAARVMDLQHPREKMSKSARDDQGVIRVLDPPEVVRRKIARAATDADTVVRHDPQRQPGVANLLEILSACTGQAPHALAGQLSSYRQLKDATSDAVVELLAPVQHRYRRIMADPGYVTGLLRHGAASASALAAPTLTRAKAAIGLVPTAEAGTPTR
jgi:tryptophanyl-tRNA synthetase